MVPAVEKRRKGSSGNLLPQPYSPDAESRDRRQAHMFLLRGVGREMASGRIGFGEYPVAVTGDNSGRKKTRAVERVDYPLTRFS
jgi:hypothetical protein